MYDSPLIPRGPAGPRPEHRWNGTKLEIRNPDGTWDTAAAPDLRGPQGESTTEAQEAAADALSSKNDSQAAADAAAASADIAANATKISTIDDGTSTAPGLKWTSMLTTGWYRHTSTPDPVYGSTRTPCMVIGGTERYRFFESVLSCNLPVGDNFGITDGTRVMHLSNDGAGYNFCTSTNHPISMGVNSRLGPYLQLDNYIHAYFYNCNLGIGTPTPLDKLVVSNGALEAIQFRPGATPNVSMILAFNQAGNAYDNLKLYGQTVTLGQSGSDAWVLQSDGAWRPAADNAFTLGTSSYRVGQIYSGSSTILTSDARAKEDVAPLDPKAAVALVRSVLPVGYRWKIGGKVAETVVEQEIYDVPVMDEVEETRIEHDVVDGVAKERSVTVTTSRPIVDQVPVVDAAGQPVMKQAVDPATSGPLFKVRTSADGTPVLDVDKNPVLDPVMTQATHAVPRVRQATRDVTRTVHNDRAGVRRHLGWLAQDWQAALQKQSLDVGLLVKIDPNDPDSELALRPDQVTPVLHAALLNAFDRIDALETRLTALSKTAA